jgi:hypothetical protein
MSRRHNATTPLYGQIKLKCPYKHELGAILVQPRRPAGQQMFYRIAKAISAPDTPENCEMTFDPIEPGMPVIDRCQRCGKTWQAPWDVVEPEIAKLVNTPVVTLTLRGRPLC